MAAVCSYTSAEGRKCKTKTPTVHCIHHTCSGCAGPKPSRSMSCADCLSNPNAFSTCNTAGTTPFRALTDYGTGSSPNDPSVDYRAADAPEISQVDSRAGQVDYRTPEQMKSGNPDPLPPLPAGAPPKTAKGKPACWEKKMLLAQAEIHRPTTEHMKNVLSSFGHHGGAVQGDLAHKFNYAEVEFAADDVFRLYDVDKSGTIDGSELRSLLFALGVKVSDDSVAMAMRLLGIKTPADSCTFDVFHKWWTATYAKSRAARGAMLQGLGKEIAEFLIPELKSLFAESDKDCSGALDAAEFQKFYPRLCAFLGYKIPAMEQCLKDMDSVRTSKAENLDDGTVEYEEFEAWFLKQEQKRVDAAAASK
eukprot:m.245889 g.245889  ORF g.245889 m.245889 type:complete len:363 (-) comp26412_c0_seq4:226-1314(-)